MSSASAKGRRWGLGGTETTARAELAPSLLAICGISELLERRADGFTQVLSLLDPDEPEPDAFSAFGPHMRTTLRFDDIIAPARGCILPSKKLLEAILRFGLLLAAGPPGGRLLVHCHMGISRSPAALLVLMAQASPDEPADHLFSRLAQIRPEAWPNSKLIQLADEEFGHAGELIAGLRRHYGRQIRLYPGIAEGMTRLGRRAEVEMADGE